VSAIRDSALGDARTLPTARLSAFVSDPPYCSGGFTETARRKARGQGLRSETVREDGWFEGDNMGTAGLVWLLRAVAFEAHRALVDGGSLLMFCDHRQIANLSPAIESSGLRYTNLIVWNKGTPGLGMGFRAQHECILHFTKGSMSAHATDVGNVILCDRMTREERTHQTEKPVPLLRDLIRVVAPRDGIVADPFLGSGSTLEGVRGIGCERDPEKVRRVRLRCEAAVDGRDWRKPEQPSLFGGSR